MQLAAAKLVDGTHDFLIQNVAAAAAATVTADHNARIGSTISGSAVTWRPITEMA